MYNPSKFHQSRTCSGSASTMPFYNGQMMMTQPMVTSQMMGQPVMTSQPVVTNQMMTQPVMTSQPMMTSQMMGQPVMTSQPMMTSQMMGQPVMTSQPMVTSQMMGQPVMPSQPMVTSQMMGQPVMPSQPMVTSQMMGQPVMPSQPMVTSQMMGQPVMPSQPMVTSQMMGQPVMTSQSMLQLPVSQVTNDNFNPNFGQQNYAQLSNNYQNTMNSMQAMPTTNYPTYGGDTVMSMPSQVITTQSNPITQSESTTTHHKKTTYVESYTEPTINMTSGMTQQQYPVTGNMIYTVQQQPKNSAMQDYNLYLLEKEYYGDDTEQPIYTKTVSYRDNSADMAPTI